MTRQFPPEDQLLTRDEFRELVFERDHHKCVVPGCGKDAQDSHHVLERRLFPDGGYYMGNGASVCGADHLRAESTELGCDELRLYCGIEKIVLPPHLYTEVPYDKWGNEILPNSQRLKGELFFDDSVQKVIKPVLHLFTSRVKYPRSFHLPWSDSISSDDRVMDNLLGFQNEEVVVTLKCDGEQTTLDRQGFHARSLDTPSHPSRDWLWSIHRRIGHELPEGWRLCGENLFAKHSIHYQNLPAHFLVFSIWDERNRALSWNDTKEWAELLDLEMVPELYRGPFDDVKIRSLYQPVYNGDECEGYVVRVTRSFHYGEFRRVLGKYVRKNHVHIHGGHWMREAVVKNGLAKP